MGVDGAVLGVPLGFDVGLEGYVDGIGLELGEAVGEEGAELDPEGVVVGTDGVMVGVCEMEKVGALGETDGDEGEEE